MSCLPSWAPIVILCYFAVAFAGISLYLYCSVVQARTRHSIKEARAHLDAAKANAERIKELAKGGQNSKNSQEHQEI